MQELIDYRHYSILFVDDEEKSLKYFYRIFSPHFNIITTSNVNRALEILQERNEEIGLLIVDQRMPSQKGVEILAIAKRNYPSIVRILTTAYTDLDDAISAVNKGEIYRYISKPWDIDSLREQLHNAMHLFLAQQRERDILVEKQKIMFQLAGNIAHELRTPLLSIYSAAKGTNRYLPEVLDVYRRSVEELKLKPAISKTHLSFLETALEDIINEIQHALTMIDMLLTNIGGEDKYEHTTSIHSIRACIAEALDRYPLRDDQHQLIVFKPGADFSFCGSKLLLIHVFFNLLKNAIYAINAKGNEGNIVIDILPGDKLNKVRFKDTGTGISANVLPYIFESFYSTKSSSAGDSIGIGLPFCKKVLNHFDSDIECHSNEGEFTEFTLSFPLCEQPAPNAKIIPIN